MCRTLFVLLPKQVMLTTVDLDDKFLATATKVNYVMVNRILARKLETVNLTIP